MEFDCTKPLGELLEIYVEPDIKKICFELSTQGIVYEGQFKTLWSMVCKNNALELSRLFAKKTRLGISYKYDNKTCNFIFYNMDIYSGNQAIQKSIDYHK